ncbi:hypothetical protein PsYK624_151150 [Phanerochaete sordida]|uniref:Hydrophobin n=1 Tax=Phanerochaete sordida TaxID=48140 RepID=A0A9P3LKR3_9APHY|nr:hypothetical protein PsYK624_151150 [Phanerochaete sordida]
MVAFISSFLLLTLGGTLAMALPSGVLSTRDCGDSEDCTKLVQSCLQEVVLPLDFTTIPSCIAAARSIEKRQPDVGPPPLCHGSAQCHVD